jgi:tRNA threonylcarbamoyladenosine biosynthesis protein TsaB
LNNVLAIDSSGSLLSICLKSESSYYEVTLDCGLKHSENLLKQIDHLMTTSGLKKSDLQLLICSEGPGSFTGLRIAMSTVRGIAAALSIPYTAVPTTDYLAFGFDYFPGVVIPLIDAKKKCFYSAVYKKGKRISDILDIGINELLSLVEKEKNILFTGPDCRMVEGELRQGISFDGNASSGKSRQLLQIGVELYKNHGPLPIDAGPVYIRKSEAEIAMFGN